MRFQRAIELRPEPLTLPKDTGEFDKVKTTEREGYRREQHRWREGDTLFCETITTTSEDDDFGTIERVKTDKWSRPCAIDYNAIHALCQIESDDLATPPWEDCDGWEHTLVSEEDFERQFWERHDDQEKVEYDSDMFTYQRGYFYDTYGRSRGQLVVIDDAYGNGQAVYDYARKIGASKQVAAELLARWKQRYIDQIVEWRKEGWSYVGVKCEFCTGTDSYEESVWGIDDEDYAREYVTHEIASQVAYALDNDGYVVVNEPDPRANYKEHRRLEYKRRMNQFNWD